MKPAAEAEGFQAPLYYMFQNVHIWGSSETTSVLFFLLLGRRRKMKIIKLYKLPVEHMNTCGHCNSTQ